MSDFTSTLGRFAKAWAATKLPLEEIEQGKAARAAARKKKARRKAKRANPTHRAVGRLVFKGSGAEPTQRPIAFMKIELWDRDLGSADDCLGWATTDPGGRFDIAYDPDDAGSFDKPDLELRIVDEYEGRESLLFVVEGADDVVDRVYDFGDVGVPYYEYHPDIPLPHVLTLNYGKQKFDAMPQSYPLGRKLALARSATEVLGVRLKHYTVDPETTLADIQADYAGKTGYVPPNGPGEGATADERFIYKLLNGACPTTFTEDDDGALHVVRVWDAYEQDGEHYLPNVHGVFRYDGATLVPESITIQERAGNAPAAGAPLAAPVTHRPGDPGWEQAKHVLECNNYLYTQAANHLARGHFNAEQFSLAAYRNLRRSPLKDLLFPHLKEVMIINVEGERAIFGPDGLITKNGALTEVSLVQAILDNADIDWFGWSPRAPMTEQHHFAHVANLVWDVLGAHVDAFFADNLEDVLLHWDEAKRFSEDLVAHSIPYTPVGLPAGQRHHDTAEVADPDAPRIEVDGALRVVTPIVTSDEPTAEQVANLAQACRYAIYHATFWHSWINDTTDALEPSYSQYNPVDRSTPKELTDHISLNLALSQTRYGTLVRDEDGDVPSGLIDLLEARAPEFEAFGYDVRKIRSRINI